jgi:hypothetical protein
MSDMKRRDVWPYTEEDDPASVPARRVPMPERPAPRRPRVPPKNPTPSLPPSGLAPSGERPAAGPQAPSAAVPAADGRAQEIPAGEIPATAEGVDGRSAPRPETRIVAKIIDPTVRDDGRGDPQFSMQPARERPRINRAAGAPHPVRERLLARARSALASNVADTGHVAVRDTAAGAATANGADFIGSASTARSNADAGSSKAADAGASMPTNADEPKAAGRRYDGGDGDAFESLPELADDLDLIGAPERPRPERTPHVAAALPAPTALLLGTLGGLAAIGALFFALTRLDPHEPLRLPEAPLAPAPTPTLEAEPTPPPVYKVQRPPRSRVPGPWRIADAAHETGMKQLSASMGNQTFLAAVQAAGVGLKEAYRVLTAFEGVKNLDRCRPKDRFTALVDAASGRLRAFEYSSGEEDVFQAREGADGRLAAKKLDLIVKRQRAQGVVIVDGSFEDSAVRAGFEPGLGDYVNKALSGYASTADLKPGDVLGLVVQEVTVLGDFSRYAGVEALEYRPLNGERLRIYYQEHDKSRGYVDNKGRVFGKSRWTRPVPGASVTSRYNPKRMHPILKRIKPHNGIDFGAPIGTPVVAAGAGKVSFVGRAGPNGNMITIAHDAGFQTGYSHLSRFAKALKAGMRVEQRQTIGYVGSTGRSTGPHLHFSAKKNGRFIDPESLNLDGLLRLTVDQRLSSDLRRRYDRMLDALQLPEPRAPRALAASAEPTFPSGDARPLEVEVAAARAAPATPTASVPSEAPPSALPAPSGSVPALGAPPLAAAPAPEVTPAAVTAVPPAAIHATTKPAPKLATKATRPSPSRPSPATPRARAAGASAVGRAGALEAATPAAAAPSATEPLND